MSLLAFLITNPSSSEALYQHKNKKGPSELESDIQLILKKAKGIKMRVAERQKLNSGSGSWFLTRDE